MAAAVAKLGLPPVLLPSNSTPSPTPLPLGHTVRFSNPHCMKRVSTRAEATSTVAARGGEGERLAFTDPEVRLIEGLLGVQGRGRSATPQQLKVLVSVLVAVCPLLHFCLVGETWDGIC